MIEVKDLALSVLSKNWSIGLSSIGNTDFKCGGEISTYFGNLSLHALKEGSLAILRCRPDVSRMCSRSPALSYRLTRISHKGIKSGVNKLRECNYDKASSRLIV